MQDMQRNRNVFNALVSSFTISSFRFAFYVFWTTSLSVAFQFLFLCAHFCISLWFHSDRQIAVKSRGREKKVCIKRFFPVCKRWRNGQMVSEKRKEQKENRRLKTDALCTWHHFNTNNFECTGNTSIANKSFHYIHLMSFFITTAFCTIF